MKRPINILTFTQKEEPLSLRELPAISLICVDFAIPEVFSDIERKKYFRT